MKPAVLTEARAATRHARVPFAAWGREHAEIADELRAALDEVIARGDFGQGEEVARFEDEYAAFCGVSHTVGVSSGTAALTLALIASGIGPGDEVIVPAHAPLSSALGVIHAGATPVLCDVQGDTGLIDVESAADIASERTAALLAVHLYGQPCDMDAVCALAERRAILVVEDAAHAPGARFAGTRTGALGDVAAFGFSSDQNLGALGDGGAVCTDDAAIAERVRRLRDLGRGCDGAHVEIGFEAGLQGIQAAALRVKLRRLERKNAARRTWAEMYRATAPRDATMLWEDARAECVYHLFPARVANRATVLEGLRRRGIAAGVHHWPPLHAQPPLIGYRLSRAGLGATEEWSSEELLLPMFPELSADEVARVGEAFTAAVQ